MRKKRIIVNTIKQLSREEFLELQLANEQLKNIDLEIKNAQHEAEKAFMLINNIQNKINNKKIEKENTLKCKREIVNRINKRLNIDINGKLINPLTLDVEEDSTQ